jgi:DnaJ-class molecular chaperone
MKKRDLKARIAAFNDTVRCPVCGGMGWEIDRFNHFLTRDCWYCKGKGRIHKGSKTP